MWETGSLRVHVQFETIPIQENHKVNFSHFFSSGKNSSDFRQFPFFLSLGFPGSDFPPLPC